MDEKQDDQVACEESLHNIYWYCLKEQRKRRLHQQPIRIITTTLTWWFSTWRTLALQHICPADQSWDQPGIITNQLVLLFCAKVSFILYFYLPFILPLLSKTKQPNKAEGSMTWKLIKDMDQNNKILFVFLSNTIMYVTLLLFVWEG